MSKRLRTGSEESLPDLELAEEFSKTESLNEKRIITGSSDSSHSYSDPEDEKILSSSLRRDAGVSLEPFDERLLESEGNFMQKDEHQYEERDPWLDSVDEGNVSDSAESMQRIRRNAELTLKYWESSENGHQGPDQPIENYIFGLIELLRPNENPRSAMDRALGKLPLQARSGGVKSTIKARRKHEKDVRSNIPSVSSKDVSMFECITEASDALIAKGLHNILQESREALQERLEKFKFEYKWKERDDGKIFGPFNFDSLVKWNEQGCFNHHPILVRYYGSNHPWREFLSQI